MKRTLWNTTIALQDPRLKQPLDKALQDRLAAIYSDLLTRQTELPEFAQQVLADRRWELYEVVADTAEAAAVRLRR